MKKFPGDVIMSHMHTKYHTHKMYGSWDIEWDRQKNFVILGHFLFFQSPDNLKNQSFKIEKKYLDIL